MLDEVNVSLKLGVGSIFKMENYQLDLGPMALYRNTEIELKAESCIFRLNKAKSGQVPFHS